MIKIGGNFLFCLSIRAIPHFKDQVSPTCVEGDVKLCFHKGVIGTQSNDTLSWVHVVGYLHIVILAGGLIVIL